MKYVTMYFEITIKQCLGLALFGSHFATSIVLTNREASERQLCNGTNFLETAYCSLAGFVKHSKNWNSPILKLFLKRIYRVLRKRQTLTFLPSQRSRPDEVSAWCLSQSIVKSLSNSVWVWQSRKHFPTSILLCWESS